MSEGDEIETISKFAAVFTSSSNFDKNGNEIDNNKSLEEDRERYEVLLEIPATKLAAPIPTTTRSRAVEASPQATSSDSLALSTFLSSSVDGKLILKSFKDHNYLTPKTRARLVRLVVRRKFDSAFCNVPDGETLDEFTITAKRFKSLAQETCELFSGPNPHIYYIPSCSEGDSVTTTAGAFWHHYNYMKGVYRRNGLLRKPESSTTAAPQEGNQISSCDEKLAWLENHLEPWEEIVTVWGQTFYDRKRLLADTEKSVFDYLNQFPCLHLQEGSNLLKADFEKLYPGKEDILFQRWPTIRKVIQQHLEHVTIKDSTDKAYFFLLQTSEPEHQDAIILHLLPYLFDGRARPGKRKYPKKSTAKANVSQKQSPRNYSLQERREGLLIHVNTVADVESSLRALQDNLRKKGDHLQPSVVVIGPLHRIEGALVIVDNIRYQVPSCLHAVDLIFKAFFALDCDYPNCARLPWIFIQKSGYDLSLPTDHNSQSLTVVCSQVSKALAES